MTRSWRGPLIGVATALLVLVVGSDLSLSRGRRPDARRELHRQEMQVKRARRVTRRVIHDRRASEAIKRQAQELEQLLAEREGAIEGLENLHRDFVARHRADIDELSALRRHAMEIDNRLRVDRKQTLAIHGPEVKALVASADRAEELIEALTDAYSQDKRSRRKPRGQG